MYSGLYPCHRPATCKHRLARSILELRMWQESNDTTLSNCARRGPESAALPLLLSNDKVHMSRFLFSCSPRPSASTEPKPRRRASSYLCGSAYQMVVQLSVTSVAWSDLLRLLSINSFASLPSPLREMDTRAVSSFLEAFGSPSQ
jgi:hypothetical protein